MSATDAHAHAGRWQPYPAYKPSGVEWLGDIPAHWDFQRLKFLFIDTIQVNQSCLTPRPAA
jgi:type I restriction enzyme, S subunit